MPNIPLSQNEKKAEKRAIKAIEVLKLHQSGQCELTEIEQVTLNALVIKQSQRSLYFFAKYVLEMDLLTEETHEKWCDNLQVSLTLNKKRIMRLKPRATYKCLRKGTPLLSYGINDKYDIVEAKLFNQKDFIEDGIEVVLASGRKHVCTKDHLFKTIDGWEPPRLKMRVAIARKIENKYVEFSEAEEYLMGLLVGDGCLLQSTPILTCVDEEIITKIREYGFDIIKSDNISYRIRNFYKQTKSSGLVGSKSKTKFIPAKYEGSAHFLRGLFDADGSVSKRQAQITFVTVSERLADDVMRNLLYYGIVGRKKYYEYDKTLKSPEVKCYHITIYSEFLKAYDQHIGFIHNKKRERLRHWVTGQIGERLGKNNNVDTIPGNWRKLLKQGEKRILRYEAKKRIDNKYCHSRNKVSFCGQYLNNKDVLSLSKADIFWDEIVSIKDVGPTEFSAIGSDIENYLSSDGVIHHNTTVYGIAFILWVWACQSPQVRIFYTSANALLLSEVSDKINQYVGSDKGSTLYSSIFDITKDSTAKNTLDVFNIKGRSGKGFSLILRSAGGSTVGIHPNLIVVDDPLDQNDRESQATRDQKERWFDSLTPLIVPFFCKETGIIFDTVLYIGTVWHMRDLIWHITEMNKKLPEKQKWDIERESILTPEGVSAYPEFISMDKINEIKATISSIFFAAQYLNQALSEETLVFNLDRLFFVRPEQVDISKGQMLCVFDPSLGKSHSDYPAVWWLHYYEDTITFYDAIDKKIELSLIVHNIAYKNKVLGCRHLLYEDNGTTLVKEALVSAHARISHKIIIESVHHSSNKDERIISMQPDIYSGHAKFMSDYETRYPEAMNQIVFYPAYGPVDFPDAAQMGIEYFRKPHFQFQRYEECY